MKEPTWFEPAARFMRIEVTHRRSSAFLCGYAPILVLPRHAGKSSFSTITPIPISLLRIWTAPSARHCVAAGLIDDKKGHQQGAVVVTSDGWFALVAVRGPRNGRFLCFS